MEKTIPFKTASDCVSFQQRIYEDAYSNPRIASVRKVAPPCSRKARFNPQIHNMVLNKPMLYGAPESLEDSLQGLRIRRNFTLFDQDSSQPILQQFGPSRQYQHTNIASDTKKGRELFDEVLKHCTVKETANTHPQINSQDSDSHDQTNSSSIEPGNSNVLHTCSGKRFGMRGDLPDRAFLGRLSLLDGHPHHNTPAQVFSETPANI